MFQWVEVSHRELRKGDVFDVCFEFVSRRRKADLGYTTLIVNVIGTNGSVLSRHRKHVGDSETVLVRREV